MRMKKNIIYIGNLNLPYSNAAAQRALNNSKLLSALGYNVYLLGMSKSDNNYIQWTEYEDSIFIKNVLVQDNIKNKIRAFLNLKLIFSEIRDLKIDLIIAYNYPSLPLMSLIYYSKKNNIKIVSDITEWYSINGYSFPKNIFKGIDVFIRMRILNKMTDGIIVISKLLNNYYRKRKTITIPPLVDIYSDDWLFALQNYTTIKQNAIPIFSYVGDMGIKKDDLYYILDCFTKLDLNSYILNIIGVSRENIYKHLSRFNINETKYPNINFIGRVCHKKALFYLINSDYSLIIRDSNRMNNAGFPTKFSESYTCKTSVIATEISNITDYASLSSNLIVTPKANLLLSLDKAIENHQESIYIKKDVLDDTFHYANYIQKMAIFIASIYN